MTDPIRGREQLNRLIAACPPDGHATRLVLTAMLRAADSDPNITNALNNVVPALIGAVTILESRISKLEGSTEVLDQRIAESAQLADVIREIFPDGS
jgi:hypothetical protein